VARIGWSRDDVKVTIDGMPFPPPAGLGSWAAFKAIPNGEAMVMGDTVVFEDEITPAMDAAFEHGLDVTALHNHFIFDRPPVYFMHIGGMGKRRLWRPACGPCGTPSRRFALRIRSRALRSMIVSRSRGEISTFLLSKRFSAGSRQ
jgi:hypothetical protein